MTLSASYTSEAEAADISLPAINVNRYGYPPRALFLDIPILSADHDNPGFYVAMYNRSDIYAGGILKMSSDGGSAFKEMAFFNTQPARVGLCATAPGAGAEPGIIDYSVSLTVDFTPVAIAPSSATEDELWVGANLAALGTVETGWELLQFKTAAQVSGYTYTLTGLLRGLYGTAWRKASHVANQFFVLLANLTGIQRISLTEDQIGTDLLYRATPFHSELSLINEQFANTAVGLIPYAPTQIRGTRNASRDLAIAWKRNDRLAFTVADLAGTEQVPQSEGSESYEVDIRNTGDSATLRTLTASSQSTNYTAVQQTTDFGSAQNSINVRIYQIGSQGRGYAGAATL